MNMDYKEYLAKIINDATGVNSGDIKEYIEKLDQIKKELGEL